MDKVEIFNIAAEMDDPAERLSYLDKACGSDQRLRADIESLLESDRDVGDYFKVPVIDTKITLGDPLLTESPGSIIGRYKLLEKIGEGGMAVVYMAEQQEPIRRKVALKIIKLGMDTKSIIARFEAERQALAMMDHPNIAKVLDAGATDTGRPYFVMELVKGASITDFCDANNLNTYERLKLFVQVCQAVQHAHQKGIIHRDIKPTNVMVTLHDGVPIPKVIDFGIAKAVNCQLTEKTLFTRYAQIIGTPAYMSPEQAELSGLDIDIRTDVFSLGTLLYELLTGSPPFESEYLLSKGYEEMQRIIRKEKPIRPSTKVSTMGEARIDVAKYRNTSPDALHKLIRDDVDWIVMKTLEKDRDRRYDSVGEFAVDIKRYLNNEPVMAGPPGVWYRTKKFFQRHGKLAAILVIGMVMIVTGSLVCLGMYFQAEQARKEADVSQAEAQSVADFLTDDLLASVYPEKAKGQEVTVRYLLESASEKLDERFANNPLAEATVRDAMALTYQKMSKYRQAEPHMKRVLEIRRAQLGEEDPATLAALDRLGQLYGYQGRFEEAEELLVDAFEARKRILGPECPDTLESMSHLAWFMHAKAQGSAFAKEAHEMTQRMLGKEHPITLEATAALALNSVLRFRLNEAETIIPEAYERSLRILGKEHQTTLLLMNTLVMLYERQKRFDTGVPLAEEVLEIANYTYGETHFLTVFGMTNLGSLYTIQGRYNEAESLLNKSIELGKRHLGEDHDTTLCGHLKLGILYRKQGRYEEYDKLLIDVFGRCRSKYGEDGILTGYAKYGLNMRIKQLSELIKEQNSSGDKEGAGASSIRLEQIRQALECDFEKPEDKEKQ
jgi:tetratricopeptide (TPR) repeat protein